MLEDQTRRPSVGSDVYSLDYLINSFWTLKVKNHDLYKEGFVGVNLT